MKKAKITGAVEVLPPSIEPAATMADNSLVPKPTRKEIIAALLVLAEQEYCDKAKAQKEEREAILKEGLGAFLGFLNANPMVLIEAVNKPGADVSTWRDSVHLNINLDHASLPEETVAAMKKWYDQSNLNARYRGQFCVAQARAEIISKLDHDEERVEALAESPEIKALWNVLQGRKAPLMLEQ